MNRTRRALRRLSQRLVGCGIVVAAVAVARLLYPTAAVEPGQGHFRDAVWRYHGLAMPYVVYEPPGYSREKRWPVILYLHGWGERGHDGRAPLQAGLAPQLRRHPERFPCLVVIPQTRSTRWSGQANALAFQAMNEVVRTHRGDRSRLYLTGVSMGGAGCWRLAAEHPNSFAAALPICGQGKPREVAERVRSLPIWAFQGALDSVVPPRRTRAMVDAVRAAGNHRIRYTLYTFTGHNAWDRAYGDPAVISWLLAQRK